MSAFDPKRTFGGQYLENLNELDPRLRTKLTVADRLALSPGSFNLVDNVVLQQKRIGILFTIALHYRCSQSSATKIEHFRVPRSQLWVQLFARHF